MSAPETIAWLERAIAYERAQAVSWAMSGWPQEANYYRRQALKAMRILRQIKNPVPEFSQCLKCIRGIN